MAIDLTTAVSSVNSLAHEVSGTNSGASKAGATIQDWDRGVRSAERAAQADLFENVIQQQTKPPVVEVSRPDDKAKGISNPAALGEQVLQRMEGLHDRDANHQHHLSAVSSSSVGTDSGSTVTMAGPAAQHVAGTATSTGSRQVDHLKGVFDWDMGL